MELDQEQLIIDIIGKVSVLKNIDIEVTLANNVPDDVKYLLSGISSISLDIEKKAKKLLEINDGL